jgi:hypothetical protein
MPRARRISNEDAGADDLAALIGDGPDDIDDAGEADSDGIDDATGPAPENDDGANDTLVAAE